jgi:hypothetical protein
MHDVNWKDPKLLIGIFAGVAAVGMALYNCRGSTPGVPLNEAEETQKRMYAIAHRTLTAIQAGTTPTTLADLPKVEKIDEQIKDGWGSEISFTITDGAAKMKTATLISPGADKAAGTPDDITCTAVFRFEPGPGYDVYVQGPIDFVLPGNP